MYQNGQGVIVDYIEAMKWYKKAADLGNDYALANIGTLYQNGQGVSQNNEEAVKWYKKAAELGNEGAKKNLKALGITGY